MKHAVKHIHFVGVGGAGMSGIAEILHNLGYTVSGSDQSESATARRLASLGIRVFTGHDAAHIEGAEAVVTSTAVKGDNPEVIAARAKRIPVVPRAVMLAELMRLKQGIAIAGTHGKTTTTSLVTCILAEAGVDPTFVIGGKLNSAGANSALGKGDYIVVEADESDASFLNLLPILSVVTNIDAEHLDHYGSHENVKNAFVEFANKTPFYGLGVFCVDHPHVQEILPRIHRRFVTYGTSHQADFRAKNLQFNGLETSFDCARRGEALGRFTVRMPGAHNVLNALAVIAVADGEKLSLFQNEGNALDIKLKAMPADAPAPPELVMPETSSAAASAASAASSRAISSSVQSSPKAAASVSRVRSASIHSRSSSVRPAAAMRLASSSHPSRTLRRAGMMVIWPGS